MSTLNISGEVSAKFRFWSFISMVLLVFVHGYNMQIRYLQPWTVPGEPLSFTGFLEYFIANGLVRFRIPMLFIISGFLYAMHDHKPYKQRTGKRFRTLFLPYLIWSLIGLAGTWLLEMTEWGRMIVGQSNVVRIDDTRTLLHEYRWYELLVRWLLIPVPYQLWFIRVLFIYNLAYPAIRWCVQHRTAKWIFFGLAFLMWLSTSGFVIVEGEGLLFFSLGILIQKSGFDIEKPVRWMNPLWWGVLFVLLAGIKTFMAFKGEAWLGGAVYPVLAIQHKIVVLSGLIACWYGLDSLVRWCMKRQWFVWLSAFAFMIYALHTPLVAYLIDPALQLLEPMPGYQLSTFILLPLAVIVFCILAGVMLRTALPGVYKLLTGGRGF